MVPSDRQLLRANTGKGEALLAHRKVRLKFWATKRQKGQKFDSFSESPRVCSRVVQRRVKVLMAPSEEQGAGLLLWLGAESAQIRPFLVQQDQTCSKQLVNRCTSAMPSNTNAVRCHYDIAP